MLFPIHFRGKTTLSEPGPPVGTLILIFIVCACLLGSGPCSLLAGQGKKAADSVVDNQPIDITSNRYQIFFNELVKTHGFERPVLESLFADLTMNRRVLELMDRQWEATPYFLYRTRFLSAGMLFAGRQYLATHSLLFDRIEKRYRVNREVIVAIWGIESRFGSNQGRFNIFQTLNSLFDGYPRRSDFFRQELLHYLVLCRENGLDPKGINGSFAGAFGQAQFMPSSFNRYGVDFDGDAKIDLLHSRPDIFASIANYLHSHNFHFDGPYYADIGSQLHSPELQAAYQAGSSGKVTLQQIEVSQKLSIPQVGNDRQLEIAGLARSPEDGGGMRYVAGYRNFQAITAYNHSHRYAMTVCELAKGLAN